MTLLDDFVSAFEARYRAGDDRGRWLVFQTIARLLLSKCAPVTIIETGTARWAGNYLGDGQSSVLWEWLARNTGGHAWSVDLDAGAVETAKKSCGMSRYIDIIAGDSISFLCEQRKIARKCDLLYLDSFDWTHNQKGDCVLHHAGELASVWPVLPSGCLVAVDDCISTTEGKHLLVDDFFCIAGIEPLHRGYITVWAKP